MNKKNIMYKFINTIENNNLMTEFIINIFDYQNFNKYNYIFRMIKEKDNIIIDIYDNISDNRFNRYIFCFTNCNYDIKRVEESNVYVTYISINNIKNNENKLYKLAYLFSLDKNTMINYAKTFLNHKFITILESIIK